MKTFRDEFMRENRNGKWTRTLERYKRKAWSFELRKGSLTHRNKELIQNSLKWE